MSKRKTSYIRRGVFWNSLNSIARYGITFLGTIILARMLSPEDYGLIGILTVFISVAEVLIDAGLGGAVIKKNNATAIDYSTLTVYNLCASIVIYVIFFVIAPYVGSFYDKPVLERLLRLYSIVILIYSFTIVPRVQLIKQLRFKELSLISLISGIGGLVTAIVMAYLGFGTFSLIGQYICNALITTILVWVVSHYKITFQFSYASFKEQFAFGMNTTLANSLKAISENIYANVIGKTSSIHQTGYYTQSSRLSAVPTNFLSSLIDNTFFPIFSQETDKNEFSTKLSRLNQRTCCITVLMFGSAVPVCHELILILLGEQWLEAEQTLEILLVGSMFMSIAFIGRNILKCLAKTFLILKIEIYLILFSFLLLVIASFGGYYYIVICLLCASIVKAFCMNYIAYRQLGIGVMSLFKPVLIVVGWTAMATACAYSVKFFNLIFYESLALKLAFYIAVISLGMILNKKYDIVKI